MNLRYGALFKGVRKLAKYFLSSLYPVTIRIFPLPKVKSIEETLDKIIRDKSSISRFGDGEFLYLMDKLNLPFQKYDANLAERMKMILKSKHSNCLVGLPIGYYSLENLHKESKRTWKSQVSWIYPRLRKYLDLNKTYYNSSMTRVYAPYEDKTYSKEYFKKLMKIWESREVLLIEGEKSRLGVGNNLFSKAVKLERIIAPMHHAFERYEDLFNASLKHSKDKLILIALGPTATALSFDLAQKGYQAIDIGNVDIEYEWFLRGAKSKVKIQGKYTSEAIGGRDVEEIVDEKYENEIIARII